MHFSVGTKIEILIQWDKGGKDVKVMQASSTNPVSVILGVIDHTLSLREEAVKEIAVKISDADINANVTRGDGIWAIVINEAGKEITVQARKSIDGRWTRLK